jgi:proline iminopeptidase
LSVLQNNAPIRRGALLVLTIALMAPARPPQGLVTVAPGVRLFVREIGHGSPIVVLHGGPGLDMNYLAADLEPLGRSHRVVFYDQRGAGRSSLDPAVTAADLVADLDALRRSLKLDRLTLLGHSWGGGLAALYAFDHPDRVERLILVDSIPARRSGLAGYGDRLQGRLSEDDRARFRDALSAREQAKTGAEQVAACRAYWGALAKAYFSDPAAAARDKGDLCSASGEAIANGVAVNASVMGGLGDYDWRAAASKIAVPTLVIHGADDPIPVDTAREWASIIPNARLVVIPHAGHMSYVEQPDQFFGAIERFLHDSN